MVDFRRNILPNASFELDFGDHVPTNWADTQNELSLKLQVLGQIAETQPRSAILADTVDGERVARVETEARDDEAVGHLLSPMVSVTPCTPYVISIFARSDDPSARLEIGLWTRPIDWAQTPDNSSFSQPLSPMWQRFEFACCTDELEERAVVDFKVATEEEGSVVFFDAAQLEPGALATDFATRFALEGAVAGRRERPLIHLNDSPLELYLTTHNNTGAEREERLELKIVELVGDREILTYCIDDPIPMGRDERLIALDFPFIGEFRARLYNRDGAQISPEDYIFVNYPVFEDVFQGVVYTRKSAVFEMPAQRSVLPWTNDRNWYSDPGPTLTLTDDDAIHVQTSDGHTVMRTPDGGRSWESLQVEKTVNSVLRDGGFMAVEPVGGDLVIYRSDDQGSDWELLSRIEGAAQAQIGPIEALSDGSLILPVGIMPALKEGSHTVYAFRSMDGGLNWSDGAPICPGGEPQILELHSGRLLAFCRNNPMVPPDALGRPFRNKGPWQLWQRFQGTRGLSSYTKRITLAESDDGGLTWHSQRPATWLLEEMHGGAVQLPDGRVVFIYTHRGPTHRGGERAKVSSDEGKTWHEELYFLTASPSYPGYSGSCVLPPHLADGDPGMILSVVGERAERNWGSEGPSTDEGFVYKPKLQAIRWRPVH